MITLPHWPIHTGASSKNSIELMQQALELMGNPQNKLKNIVHIAGTNGKGSTVAYISSILRASGKTCNSYTSPHIFIFEERFNINGQNASNEQVFQALEETRAVCEKARLQPTVLEASTLACMWLFAQKSADFNIIECCMGGKLDNTNIFQNNVICTGIASISMDHMKFLGQTIEEIALHKASIQKQGVPAVIAKQKNENALKLLYNYAKKFGVPASFWGDFLLHEVEIDDDDLQKMQKNGILIDKNTRLLFENKENQLFLPKPPLLGEHQLENLATAVQICLNLGIDSKFFATGIAQTKWIGRLQRIFNKKFPPSWEVWFDGAHNPDGARALVEWILPTRQKTVEDFVIIGKSQGANQVGFISQFKTAGVKIIFTTVKGEIFPETSANLQKFGKNVAIDGEKIANIEELPKILPPKCRIIACGSLYLLKDLTSFGKSSG